MKWMQNRESFGNKPRIMYPPMPTSALLYGLLIFYAGRVA